ncbi:hypothetical protein [Rhodocyclus gracilis]|uniref:CR-type domain-containing protein n=1 Tax=Rhodocyclus tenuis TaxID=1066 RepID=A0A6L5JW97_RHOTE|nr:hypothetical protein [Rhodocyclus gracilis]MQY51301.1 hypothetical protein [Rhodocyclus gracilis]
MTSTLAANYADSAAKEVLDFVERSTRFIAEDLRFSEIQCSDVSFRVEVLHKIRCSLAENTTAGRVQHSSDDLVAASGAEYKTLSESLRTEATGNHDVISNLAKNILDGHYGQYIDDTNYGSYQRSVYFTYTCPTCSGAGNVTCDSCHGSGNHTCSHCGGMGSTSETHWETDHRGNSTSTTHSETCTWCMGSGHTTCSNCGGSGEVTCSTCKGHSELTDTATPAYVVNSRYSICEASTDDRDVDYALSVRAHLPTIDEYLASISSRNIETREELQQILEQVSFACPFFRAIVSINGNSGKMVVFGEKCLVSDAGCLIENLVRPDLACLQNALSRIRWFDMPAMLYAQKIGRLFMESEVHQMAIEYAPSFGNSHDDYNDIADRLAKSLSPEYLHSAVSSMERLTSTINGETQRAAWTIALLVVGVTMVHFVLLDSYFMAMVAALGVGLLSGAVSQLLIKIQLRRTGAQRLEDFAVRRKTHRPGLLALPWRKRQPSIKTSSS